MALTYPMHALPGELLVTTELQEDVDYNRLWEVPTRWIDHAGERHELGYGDLLTVIACEKREDIEHGTTQWPTWLFHHKSQRLIYIDDIEDVGWLWRPETPTSWSRDDA